MAALAGSETVATFLPATDFSTRQPYPDARRVIDAGAAAHDVLHLLNPQLRAIHDSGARLPEECVLGMGTDLRNWGLSATMRLDSYSHWLAHEDLAGTYRRYRRLLQLAHGTDGRRLLLKAPAHTAELDHLAAAFPGVVVVHLHRDVVETVASGASLFAVYRCTYSDDVEPVDVGRFLADQTELWLHRAATARATPDIAATFLDVDYTAQIDAFIMLTADNITSVNNVHFRGNIFFVFGPADRLVIRTASQHDGVAGDILCGEVNMNMVHDQVNPKGMTEDS